MSGVLVKYSPTTPSLRGTVYYKPDVEKNPKRIKALTVGLKKTGGRGGDGRIAVRHRGGGHKKLYRIINFIKKPELDGLKATVQSLQYDPNRNANIALIKYTNDILEYMIAPENLKIGDTVQTGDGVDMLNGNTTKLILIPIGTNVHCVELKPKSGASMARSAGAYVTIVGKESGKVIVKLPSGETKIIDGQCLATIGIVSNALRKNEKIGKAGRNRWKGWRSSVRGIAMNPVDHPHGGRTNGGRDPVSPWGQKAKGLKTRNNKRTDSSIVSRRVIKKKKK
jgi:large subunit ribosomal protein L2